MASEGSLNASSLYSLWREAWGMEIALYPEWESLSNELQDQWMRFSQMVRDNVRRELLTKLEGKA